jgi:hypothetical protein
MSNTETIGETEVFVFEEWDHQIPCSYEDCQEAAVNMLQCNICNQGAETICGTHTDLFRLAQVLTPESTIHFDQSCGHFPEFQNTLIVPLP